MSEILARLDAPAESKRGIPHMAVVEDIEAFLKKEGDESAEDAVARMREAYQKYKYVEKNISAQRERMADKLPEYEQNLAMIEMLLERKEKEAPFDTHYMLAEYAWTKARVEKPEFVSVWLGANVMVEYPLEEARALFIKNKKISHRCDERAVARAVVREGSDHDN